MNRNRRRQVPEKQPLPGESLDERREAGIRDHPANLLIEDRRIAEPRLLRQLQQFLVGNAAPQEKRQPRRELDIADPVRPVGLPSGADPTRSRSRNSGLTSRRRSAAFDAFVESTVLASGPIEREHRLDIGVHDRTAIRAPRQRPEDRSGASRFVRPGRRRAPAQACRSLAWPAGAVSACGLREDRAADENALPARRLSRTGRIVRTGDLDAAQVGARPLLRDVHAGGVGSQERQAHRLRERSSLLDEGDLDVARAGLHRHAHFPVAVGPIPQLLALPVSASAAAPPRRRPGRLPSSAALRGGRPRLTVGSVRRAGGCIIRVVGSRLLGRRRRRRVDAGQREQLDPLAVDAHLELLRLRVDRHLFVEIARQLDANRVLRVHRERVVDGRAAARAEQLAGQAIVLGEIVGDPEIVDGRKRRRGSDRRAADLLRRRQIPLHQRRRQLQYAGNVVEAVARVVGRKQRRRRRCGDRAGRGRRSGIRCGSAGGAARFVPDSDAAWRRDRARLRATPGTRRGCLDRDAACRPAASDRPASSARRLPRFCASSLTWLRSRVSNATGTVPRCFCGWLWQPRQFLLRNADCASIAGCPAARTGVYSNRREAGRYPACHQERAEDEGSCLHLSGIVARNGPWRLHKSRSHPRPAGARDEKGLVPLFVVGAPSPAWARRCSAHRFKTRRSG